MFRRLAKLAVVVVVGALLFGGSGTAQQLWDRVNPGGSRDGEARVIRWIDGDTVVTSAGTVRLVGVDTPERGRCGYTMARLVSERAAPRGTTVTLIAPAGVDDEDRYERLLRYVDTGRTDVGATQIAAGAWARYDSRDGYARHSNQREYRALDAQHRNYCGTPHP